MKRLLVITLSALLLVVSACSSHPVNRDILEIRSAITGDVLTIGCTKADADSLLGEPVFDGLYYQYDGGALSAFYVEGSAVALMLFDETWELGNGLQIGSTIDEITGVLGYAHKKEGDNIYYLYDKKLRPIESLDDPDLAYAIIMTIENGVASYIGIATA